MIKLGIIGSGFGLYGLFPAFNGIPGCRVVAFCGTHQAHHQRHWDRLGSSVRVYTDWQEMLEQESLDAVAMAVTPEAQYVIAKAAIARGLHVFAEKPLGVSEAQTKELLMLAKKKKIVHGIDFIFPEIAEWRSVKELLTKERFGKLRHIAVDWDFMSYDIKNAVSGWKTDIKKGGGALSYYFSHGLNYLEHFAGPITNVQSAFTYSKESKNGAEVAVDMLLGFKNGATGFAHVCCNRRGLSRHRLEFQCDEGVIVLENSGGVVDGFTVKTYGSKGEKVVAVKKDIGRPGEDERSKVIRRLAKRFIASCVSGTQTSPSFVDGVRVQELIGMVRKNTL